jgi:hypothetical protein
MADTKISALTGATTPLAGTEVLPIVQGGTTVKVSVDNLTAGKTVAVDKLAVNGVGTPYGEIDLLNPSAGMNRAMMFTVPVAAGANNGMQIGLRREGNSEVISSIKWAFNDLSGGLGNYISINTGLTDQETLKCDSAQNVTVSAGNLVIGTSGNGIDFSATPGTGTSELLADYEEGTWTPQLQFGAANVGMVGTFSGAYTKIGNTVYVRGYVAVTNKGSSTGAARITNLPFTVGTVGQPFCPGAIYISGTSIAPGLLLTAQLNVNTVNIDMNAVNPNSGVDSQMSDTQFNAAGSFWFSATYTV